MKSLKTGLFITSLTVTVILTLPGCRGLMEPETAEERIILWNGTDFTGWDLFITEENFDVLDIWTIANETIRCEGKPNGYMRTQDEYENYHLHLEWRWPDEPTNSGVLLHTTGPDKIWPRAIECQLKAGSAGDFVLMNGTGITVDGENKQNPQQQYVVIPKKEESSEKTAGRWNTYDIYCDSDSIRCYVNDVLQNEGTAPTQNSGAICLQSEGGPIEFRNIYIVPLKPPAK